MEEFKIDGKSITSHGTNPVRWWTIDNFVAPFGDTGLPEVTWEAYYANTLEHNKQTARTLPLPYSHVQAYMESPQIIIDIRRLVFGEHSRFLLSDTTHHGAGLHLMNPEGYLQIHLDYQKHPTLNNCSRYLSAIVFLHKHWEEQWGGRFLLTNPSGDTLTALEPQPGRLILFETDTAYHGVEQLSKDSGQRISLVTNYLVIDRRDNLRTRALFIPNRNSSGAPNEVKRKSA